MKNRYIGSDFGNFLKEEGIYEEVNGAAIKRVIAYQLKRELKRNHITKKKLSEKMQPGRSEIDRLIDPNNCSWTLPPLTKAANAIGKRLEIKFT